MNSTAKHIGFFRMVYNHPQCSYIQRSIYIGIVCITAIITFKAFAIPNPYTLTIITGFTCVIWFYRYNWNTIKSAFIFNKLSELIKSPRIMFTPLFFTNLSRSNILQILNGNSFILLFSRLNNLFTYSMISNSLKSFYFP